MPLRLSRFGRRAGARRFGSRRRGYKKFPRKMHRSSFRKRRNYSRKRRFGSRRRRYQGKLMGTYNRTFPTYTSIGGKNSVSIRGRECLGYIRSMNTSGIYEANNNAKWPAYIPVNDKLHDTYGNIRAGLQGYAITCRNASMLSKLSDYAKLYDKYYVKSITFQYIPAVSTQTPGNVFMYWEPNPVQPPVGNWDSKEHFPALFARNATNSFTQVFGPMQMKVPIARKWNYTYSDQTGVDRFCDYGYLWVYCSHNTGTATSVGVGTLYCSYDIVLKFPSIPHTISGTHVLVEQPAARQEAEPERRSELVPAMQVAEVLSSNGGEVNDVLDEVNPLSRDAVNSGFINNHRGQVWNFESESAMLADVSAHMQSMRQYVDHLRPDLTPLFRLICSTAPTRDSMRAKPLVFTEQAFKYQSPKLNDVGFSPGYNTYWDVYGDVPFATMDSIIIHGNIPTVLYPYATYLLSDVKGVNHQTALGTLNDGVYPSISARTTCAKSGSFVKVVLEKASIFQSSVEVIQDFINSQGQATTQTISDLVKFGFWSSVVSTGISPGSSLYCIPMYMMKFEFPKSERRSPRRVLYRCKYLDGAGRTTWVNIPKEIGEYYMNFNHEDIAIHGPVIDFNFICLSQGAEEAWCPSECVCIVFSENDKLLSLDPLLV